MNAGSTTLIDGLIFGEGPRWHEGALWFSDIHGHQVHKVVLDDAGGVAERTVVAEFEDAPSGLGWLADGSLLVVAMETQRLMRVDKAGAVSVHADCSGLTRGSLNDMIVRSDGTAYIGDMGARIFAEHPDHSVAGQTLRVTPSGEVSCAWDDLGAPNGHILSDDELTLYVAESSKGRIRAFDVAADGSLSGDRVFAELPPAQGAAIAPPDGICLDAEGAIWVADPLGRRLIRVREGGAVSDTIDFDGATPVASVLGGADRRTLFACVADDWKRDVVIRQRSGRIVATRVAVAGAGKP